MSVFRRYRSWAIRNEAQIFFLLHLFFAASLTYSEAFISIVIGLYSIFFVSTVRKDQFSSSDKVKPILLFSSIVLLYFSGILFTNDIFRIGYLLKKSVFWLVVPLVMGSQRRISNYQLRTIFKAFLISLLILSVNTFYNFFNSDYSAFDNYREISTISHISYSLMIVFAIVVISHQIFFKFNYLNNYERILYLIIILWLLFVFVIVRSLIGVISLYFLVNALFIWGGIYSKRKVLKVAYVLLFIGFAMAPTLYVVNVYKAFYNVEELTEAEKVEKTAEGNYYTHNFNNDLKENGNYVFRFICFPELKEQWNKRSKYDINGLCENNNRVYNVLLRYMTSKGLRKDAEGISQMTDADIHKVEMGVVNWIYADNTKLLYARIYETIWEIDEYKRTDNPNNKSLMQRIEQVKLAIISIKEKPIFGYGSANDKKAGLYAKEISNSNLRDKLVGIPHLQYLTYLIRFGVVGTAWILFVVLYPFIKLKLYRNYIHFSFLVIFLVANLGDNIWETHMGLAFFTFFYSLFIFRTVDQAEKQIKETF